MILDIYIVMFTISVWQVFADSEQELSRFQHVYP